MEDRNIEYEVAKRLRPTSIFDTAAKVPFFGPRVFAIWATRDRLEQIRDYMNKHNIQDLESYDAADLDI